ncbi:hypothetical protein, conserved, partial [Trypanosoma cruzi]
MIRPVLRTRKHFSVAVRVRLHFCLF